MTMPEDLSVLVEIPVDLGAGTFRCRVIYGNKIDRIEFVPHEERIVRSLKLVHDDDIEYSFKYADRGALEALFEKRGNCDEILIIKNGYVTDTSISNIIFQNRDGHWITPDTPLLNGTMRMYLLESGLITQDTIRPGDLHTFEGAKMINCMNGLDGGPIIEMNRIIN
jgi:4-amino-4-deoxychorismate lyase